MAWVAGYIPRWYARPPVYVSSKLLEPFTRYRGKISARTKKMNEGMRRTDSPKTTMASLTPLDDENIKTRHVATMMVAT